MAMKLLATIHLFTRSLTETYVKLYNNFEVTVICKHYIEHINGITHQWNNNYFVQVSQFAPYFTINTKKFNEVAFIWSNHVVQQAVGTMHSIVKL